jgi:large subunit ribosomal protein MRP49
MPISQPLVLYANTVPLAEAHLTEWQEITFSCLPPLGGVTLALVVATPTQETPLQPFLHPGDPTWYWRWNPKNRLGQQTLILRLHDAAGQTTSYRFRCTILPHKINEQHYTLLLDDLNRTLAMLPYAVTGRSMAAAAPTTATSESAHRHPHLLETAMAFFDDHLPKLEQVVYRIARQPHTRLLPTTTRLPAERSYDLSHISRDLAHTLPATPDSPYPAEITHPATVTTVDTYENRLLKHLLHKLWQRARTLAMLAADSPKTTRLASQAQTAATRIQYLLRLPFLAEVQPLTMSYGATHILRHEPGYRQVYRLWQQFRELPDFTADVPIMHLPIHDLPRLYEYWCHLQLARVLVALDGCVVQQQQLLAVAPVDATVPADHTLYTPHLCEHQPSLVLEWQGNMLALRYQPRYRPHTTAATADAADIADMPIGSLDPHTHIPDSVVEITPLHGDEPPVLLIVDAKYRLTTSGTLPQDALADAYTYLGSIGDRTGEVRVQHVALAYPAATPPETYTSRISLLPLLPAQTESLATWLHEHLTML